MKHSSIAGWVVMLLFWGGMLLACNLPLATRESRPLPPTRPLLTLVATPSGNNIPATATLRASNVDVTLAPTATPRSANGTPTPTDETTTPEQMTLDYQISWQIDPDNPQFALATVTLTVVGGAGPYSYFRDGKPTAGATFVYRWGSCQANPGIFAAVDSSGARVEESYLEQAPCAQP